jgi:hypothetical protein
MQERNQKEKLRVAAPSPNRNLKNIDFCRHNDIKHFTRFTLQPKSAIEIG